jgi:glycosyltransferase involved in cell wall biosynthesis
MPVSKKNVALFILNVQDLSGGGGAERFFADFYSIYKQQEQPRFNLYFITDDLGNYKKTNKFVQPDANVIVLKWVHKWNTLQFPGKNAITRKGLRTFILLAAFAEILGVLLKYRISIIHLALYLKFDYPFIKFIDSLPGKTRPKIILNIVDCRIPYYFYRDEPEYVNTSAHRYHYQKLFDNVKLDGVYSWYENVKHFFEEKKLIRSNPPIKNISTRFVLNHALPGGTSKKNIIVFAARLSTEKNPLFFIEAVHLLRERGLPELENWHFKLYGRGHLEEAVKQRIATYGLEDQIELGFSNNMAEVFAATRCFVSAQDFENFPSLSMAEAMINKNAIIARNVGQTHFFVHDNVNGFLLKEDTPKGLADCLEAYIKVPHKHDDLGKESHRLMTEVHNPTNFIHEIDSFWDQVSGRK